MNIPPDQSEKLWQLTESQDAKAIEAFLKKHPEFKAEFQARSKMITGIKGSRPIQKKTSKERFMPSPKPLSIGPNRWAAALAASVLIFGAVFATVGTLKYIENKTSPQKPLTIGEVQDLTSSTGTPRPQQKLPPIENNPPVINDPTAVQPLQATRAIDRPVTIVAKAISLSSALNDIGLQAGVRLNSAPGMPDPEITLDYRDVPAIKVLQSLGQQFGFTPMIETQNSILLIPARDPNTPSDNQLPGFSGSSTEPSDENSGLLPIPTPETQGIRGQIDRAQR
jgi:hypothetical protein